MQKTVFVGVSGGVDSSVSLLRLKQQGYNVVAVFIRTWQPDFIECTWKKERLDAMRVAAHLDVPFITMNAEETYKEKVADYMIREYSEGRTPNPDVTCNEHVKFGVFYEFARAHGADFVATGHYARIHNEDGVYTLQRGVDKEKDQSYFLWRVRRGELPHIVFPIGDSEKSTIRREASRAGLPTSHKKDSQGICFLGHIDMYEFLKEYIPLQDGAVLDTEGNIIGTHKGARIYTVGQRQGFNVHTHIDTNTPHYVVSRDIDANTITVHTKPSHCENATIELSDINLLIDALPDECDAEFHYRQKPFRVRVHMKSGSTCHLTVLTEAVNIPARGQSCVFYNGAQCLGGGVINSVIPKAILF